MKRRGKLIIKIIGILIALIIGTTILSEVVSDDDDCGYSCEYDD
jgi:hypothetical protein